MVEIIRIGLDTSKGFFQLHGVDAGEHAVLRRQLKRDQVLPFFAKLPSTLVALEACCASHHWARELERLGHRVRLIAPQLSKPYVSRGKNDAADAAALCEAVSRPSMRFVPVKSAEQQADLMLAGQRARLVRQRVGLINSIRGHAAEFGIVAAKGPASLGVLPGRLAEADIPAPARELFSEMFEELAALSGRIATIDKRLRAWHAGNETARRLTTIPGVGALIASLLVMKTPDPSLFASGRDFAAWLGLTPKDHSTAGKTRHGCITRAGDPMLRSLLVVGATAVVWQTRRGKASRPIAWVQAMLERKAPKLVAVALANKIARIAWKLMISGERYQRPAVSASHPAAA